MATLTVTLGAAILGVALFQLLPFVPDLRAMPLANWIAAVVGGTCGRLLLLLLEGR